MCLRPRENWQEITGRPAERTAAGIKDYQVTTDGAWNWALLDGESMKAIIEPEKARAFKKGEDAARVLVKAVRLDQWTMEGNVAAQPPIQPVVDAAQAQVIELTPYGNSSLRISQFPVGQDGTHD